MLLHCFGRSPLYFESRSEYKWAIFGDIQQMQYDASGLRQRFADERIMNVHLFGTFEQHRRDGSDR